MSYRDSLRLKPEELCAHLNTDELKFSNTRELRPLDRIVGQERAMRSLEVGLGIKARGFNIFVSGRTGTGRTSIVTNLIRERALKEPVPSDWIYVYDFTQPDRPKAISLPPGTGILFSRSVDSLISSCEVELRKLFTSPVYQERKNALEQKVATLKHGLFLKVQQSALNLGFAIEPTPQGILTIPVKDGKKLSPEEFEALSEEEKKAYGENSQKLHQLLEEMVLESRRIDRQYGEELRKIEKELAYSLLEPLFQKYEEPFQGQEELISWLKEVKNDLVSRLREFREKEGAEEEKGAPELGKYRVNVFVNRAGLKGAPVIFEPNPSYYNLMGKIEYRSAFGTWITDQTMIKAGALQQANGGYLIVPAQELLASPFSWEALKRALRSDEARVENLSEFVGGVPTTTLRPEPIPVDLKVIIIGQPRHYFLLYALDEDFPKLFKIRADFDTEFHRNEQSVADYASFINLLASEDPCISHFDAGAVASLVEYGSRLAGSKDKLSASFMEIADIAYEACYWAKSESSEFVKASHVKKALEEKFYRSRLIEDKIQEMIEKGVLLIETRGEKVGQINGLSIYAAGNYSFGKPNKITARVFLGRAGVVNIEREIALSGPIHSKGVLILTGYLGGQYAQDFPLSLSASLTFEQMYEEIEGDSASAAELFALLSALAEVSLSQEIAVTGSVNQFGEIQPIGGVNEKIEGFFSVCKALGLTGNQGVIIPKANVQHLMLKDEVVEAVEKNLFHIWAIEKVEEGLEILTGIPAGKREPDGKFTPESIHARVYEKLRQYAYQLRDFFKI
ncbi:MAG: ATP-binding protein [Coprothermobacterota bacterium]|nr:ATP-binding protein [Coprothermobacterota bacterium]